MLLIALPSFYLAGCGRQPASGTPPNQPLPPSPELSRPQRSVETSPASEQPLSPQKAKDELPSSAVLVWHREGGIAGFCDELNVAMTGELTAKSCKSTASKVARLPEAELARLEQWRRKFGAVNLRTKDSPAADAMTLTLTMKGNGSGRPTEAEGQEILDWAQKIYGQNRP